MAQPRHLPSDSHSIWTSSQVYIVESDSMKSYDKSRNPSAHRNYSFSQICQLLEYSLSQIQLFSFARRTLSNLCHDTVEEWIRSSFNSPTKYQAQVEILQLNFVSHFRFYYCPTLGVNDLDLFVTKIPSVVLMIPRFKRWNFSADELQETVDQQSKNFSTSSGPTATT